MSTYLFSYRTTAARPSNTPEGMAAWQKWFEELGERLVDGGNPIFERAPVGECGPETLLGGYSLISADDLEAATAMAAGCPLLADGGGVEVGTITPLVPENLTKADDDHARATGLVG